MDIPKAPAFFFHKLIPPIATLGPTKLVTTTQTTTTTSKTLEYSEDLQNCDCNILYKFKDTITYHCKCDRGEKEPIEIVLTVRKRLRRSNGFISTLPFL